MWLCKRDLSRECEGKYRDCTDCVLEKIRTEVMNLSDGEKPERIWNVDVSQIIEKYKLEGIEK